MLSILSMGVYALQIVGAWLAYPKMGIPGWKSIIPIYNQFVLFDKVYGNGHKVWLTLIPIYGLIVMIKLNMAIAQGFGKSGGFGVGMSFLGFVFWPILGFSGATYNDVPANDAV